MSQVPEIVCYLVNIIVIKINVFLAYICVPALYTAVLRTAVLQKCKSEWHKVESSYVLRVVLKKVFQQ